VGGGVLVDSAAGAVLGCLKRLELDLAVPDFVHADLAALGVELTAGQLGQLAGYLDRLLEANQRMNLTAVRERDAAWRRLIVDSLTVLPGLDGLPGGSRVVDVGTGGGMPGVPLAIARPDLRLLLADATGKKAAFVAEACAALGLDHVEAIQGRAETLGHDGRYRGVFDVAVCRAMGPVSVVLECCVPLVKVDGRVLAMKGPKAEQELRDASDALDKLGVGEVAVFEAYPETFDNGLVILSCVKTRPTPKAYPREPGLPKRSPL